jgi:hypothetical protein
MIFLEYGLTSNSLGSFNRLYIPNDGHSGRAVWGVGLGRLVFGIVGSNPVQGMDVCLRFSLLCCPV